MIEVQNQHQEIGANEENAVVLVIHQESQSTEKVLEAIVKHIKRTFRRLKPPTRTRRPLRELSGNGVSQSNIGKRKALIRDEEMEEANQEIA